MTGSSSRDWSGNVLGLEHLRLGCGQVNNPAGLAIGAGNTHRRRQGRSRVQRLSTRWCLPQRVHRPFAPVASQPTSVAIGPGTTINVANPGTTGSSLGPPTGPAPRARPADPADRSHWPGPGRPADRPDRPHQPDRADRADRFHRWSVINPPNGNNGGNNGNNSNNGNNGSNGNKTAITATTAGQDQTRP